MPEARSRIAESNKARWDDPAKRAAVSEATKARMADPAVRQRIKDGMLQASGISDDLRLIRSAWKAASPLARKRFLDDLFRPACDGGRDDR